MATTTKEEAPNKLSAKYPDWTLIEFSEGMGECVIEHKCGNRKRYLLFNSVLCVGPVCEACKPLPDVKWKYNIGDTIKDVRRDLTIIDRKIVPTIEYGKAVRRKYYKYHCNVCTYSCGESYLDGEFSPERWILESSIGVGVGCAVCGHRATATGINDIATLTPQRVQFFKNKNDTMIFSPVSHHVVDAQCPLCNRDKRMNIDRIEDNGIGCICGDGFSYPEKFVYGLLEQTKQRFIYQLTKTTLQWCNNKIYDFYLPDKNIIIETHGAQHYSDCGFYDDKVRTFEEEVANDKFKKDLAFSNGFSDGTYFVLDCRRSELEFIKNSIENSHLLDVLNVKSSDIDWQQCHVFAASNFIKKMCEFWEAYKTEPEQVVKTSVVAEHFHVSSGCALHNLKKGRELGWCNFLTRTEASKRTSDEVISLYNSGLTTTDIMNQLHIDRHKVVDSLTYGNENGLCSYNGKQSLIMANIGLNSPVGQPVYCIDLNIMFPTKTEGEKFIKHKLDYALRNPGKKCGGYKWKRVTKQEYLEWCELNNKTP